MTPTAWTVTVTAGGVSETWFVRVGLVLALDPSWFYSSLSQVTAAIVIGAAGFGLGVVTFAVGHGLRREEAEAPKDQMWRTTC
jgi:hypothetical protein